MNDRGWQMVRIEDTPWATNFANHYTIAIEYECLENEAIPDIAYEVLAQTWADIHAYLKQHPDLGAIALDRTTNGIRGHREWVGDGRVCPDGVSVDRIVARAAELANTPLPPPVTDMVTINGVPIVLGFLGLWRTVPEYAQLYVIGPPIAAELGVTTIPSVATAQEFQRGWMIYQPAENPTCTIADFHFWPALEQYRKH
jgi:hypothetical protein